MNGLGSHPWSKTSKHLRQKPNKLCTSFIVLITAVWCLLEVVNIVKQTVQAGIILLLPPPLLATCVPCITSECLCMHKFVKFVYLLNKPTSATATAQLLVSSRAAELVLCPSNA